MHKPCFRMLMLSALSTSAVAQVVSPPVAISCKGSVHSTYQTKVESNASTRTYVLDEARKRVAYWNPEKEEEVPVCDSSWESCSIKFGPRNIEASGNLNKQYGFSMSIDRRSGYLLYMSARQTDSKWQFGGMCSVTEMPIAQTGRNKF
jgi:hypothetical protein